MNTEFRTNLIVRVHCTDLIFAQYNFCLRDLVTFQIKSLIGKMFKLNSLSSAHKSDLTEGSSVILMFTKCVRIMQVFIRAQLSRTFYWGLCFCFEWAAALLGFLFFLGWDVSVSRLGIIGSDSKELVQEKPNHFHLCLKFNKSRFKEWLKYSQ